MNRKLKTLAALALSAALMAGSVLTANAATTSFSDVPTTHWAYSYVTRAAQAGLVSGVGDGRYGVESNLSTAEFATMVSQLLDIEELIAVYQGQSAYWWYPYVEAAYQAGALTGTTAGNRRATDGRWTATVVEADMNRYDMAQIIANVAATKNWAHAEGEAYLLAMLMIPDWSQIPAEYQSAVALSYANGFISGMEDGSFAGSKNMTRGQAAVVLCALLEAKNEVRAPSYTNPDGWLVNGSEANEDSVMDALDDLKLEYPNYDIWDPDQVYTSDELGSGTGSRGFAYMLSDRVFGACSVTVEDGPNYVKPGDVIYLDDDNVYGVVTEVDGDLYEYVYCDEDGIISWYGSGDMDDLGSYDTVYSRYEGERDSAGTLADGSVATEQNVKSILSDLYRDYGDEDWNSREDYDSYDSDILGRSYNDSESFAYFISDEIFGELDYDTFDDFDEMRPGDILYDDSREEYYVILSVSASRGQYTYAYADEDEGYIYWDQDGNLNSLDEDEDYYYTRYPDDIIYQDDDSLKNGADATVRNVLKILDDLESDYKNEYWDEDEWYDSDVLGDSRDSNEAFAYMISDEIFGDLDYEQHTRFTSMKAGDILYYDDISAYVIILDVDTKNDEFTYAYADEYYEQVYWNETGDLDDLIRGYDEVYTRYPDSGYDDRLTNGEDATVGNVSDLLDELEEDYQEGDKWTQSYDSDVLGESGDRNEGFAYMISDEIFGDLEYESLDGRDVYDMRPGDVVYHDDWKAYLVVWDTDTSDNSFTYLWLDTNNRVRWVNWGSGDWLYMDKDDTVYTRYPD